MNSLAPRCSEAWSRILAPEAISGAPSSAACALTAPNSRPIDSTRQTRMRLVMRGHPFRNRLGALEAEICIRPQKREEAEVDDNADPADEMLPEDDVRPRPADRSEDMRHHLGADQAQDDEGDGEQGQGQQIGRASCRERGEKTGAR